MKKPTNPKQRPARAPLSERRTNKIPTALRAVMEKLIGCEQWPLGACYVTQRWQEMSLAHCVLTRRRPSGEQAAAIFLVDLASLGVKDAHVDLSWDDEKLQHLREHGHGEGVPYQRCAPELIARIVIEGTRWARRHGIDPPLEFMAGLMMLRGVDAGACQTPVFCGINGEATYIPGPYDDVPDILARLEQGADLIPPGVDEGWEL